MIRIELTGGTVIGTFSRKLSELPGLAALLGEDVVHLRSAWQLKRHGIRAVIGWGLRPTTRKPRELAPASGLPFIALEDGFLRSYGTGTTHPALSLVVDEQGIYYDATRPCALKSLLASDADVFAGPGADHARARELILQARLSNYNFAPDTHPLPLVEEGAPQGVRTRRLRAVGSCRGRTPGVLGRAGAERARVLVVDQTREDASIHYGLASEATFAAMLTAARREHPGALIIVKTHPEVSDGAKPGHYAHLHTDERTVLLHNAITPTRSCSHRSTTSTSSPRTWALRRCSQASP